MEPSASPRSGHPLPPRRATHADASGVNAHGRFLPHPPQPPPAARVRALSVSSTEFTGSTPGPVRHPGSLNP